MLHLSFDTNNVFSLCGSQDSLLVRDVRIPSGEPNKVVLLRNATHRGCVDLRRPRKTDNVIAHVIVSIEKTTK